MLAGYWSGVPAVAEQVRRVPALLRRRLARYAPVPLDPGTGALVPLDPGAAPPGDALLPPRPRLERLRRLPAVRPLGGAAAAADAGADAVIACEISALATFRAGPAAGDHDPPRRAVDPPRRPGPPARHHRPAPPAPPDRRGQGRGDRARRPHPDRLGAGPADLRRGRRAGGEGPRRAAGRRSRAFRAGHPRGKRGRRELHASSSPARRSAARGSTSCSRPSTGCARRARRRACARRPARRRSATCSDRRRRRTDRRSWARSPQPELAAELRRADCPGAPLAQRLLRHGGGRGARLGHPGR